jgi:hypothetical protein
MQNINIITSDFGKSIIAEVKGDEHTCYVRTTAPNAVARFTSPSTVHIQCGNSGAIIHLVDAAYPNKLIRNIKVL